MKKLCVSSCKLSPQRGDTRSEQIARDSKTLIGHSRLGRSDGGAPRNSRPTSAWCARVTVNSRTEPGYRRRRVSPSRSEGAIVAGKSRSPLSLSLSYFSVRIACGKMTMHRWPRARYAVTLSQPRGILLCTSVPSSLLQLRFATGALISQHRSSSLLGVYSSPLRAKDAMDRSVSFFLEAWKIVWRRKTRDDAFFLSVFSSTIDRGREIASLIDPDFA